MNNGRELEAAVREKARTAIHETKAMRRKAEKAARETQAAMRHKAVQAGRETKEAMRHKAEQAAHETKDVLSEVGTRVGDRVDLASSQLGGWLMGVGDRLGGSRYYQRRTDMVGRTAGFLVGGAALGAALMYLLDPTGGRRRRALLRDQAMHLAHEAGDAAGMTARDVRNRGQGMLAETRDMFRKDGTSHSTNGNTGRMNLLEGDWPPTARLLAGVLGGALAVIGVSRRDPLGYVLGALGLGLTTRAVTNMRNMRMMKRLGMDKTYRAIDIHKTINVQAPVDEVYAFWRNFENFPRFMTHLKEVHDTGPGQSHWVASGPAGVPVEWNATITEERPQEALAWQSTPDSEVKNSGRVHFQPNVQGGTQIDVHMSYHPPAGVVGHAVATLFGDNPKQAMDEDLQRFKDMIEEGRTTQAGGETARWSY